MKPCQATLRRSGERHAAFTVLELVVVLSIIALIAGMAVPRYANFYAERRAESAVDRIKIDLELARRQAKLTGLPQTIVFDPIQNLYTLPGVADTNHPDQTYVVKLFEPPYEAELVGADFGGTTVATFDGYGTPLWGGDVTIEVGAYRYTIQLDGPRIVPPDTFLSPPVVTK